MNLPPHRSAARCLLTAVVALALVATGCSNDDDDEGGSASPRPGAPAQPKFFPLTGLPVEGDDDAARPAISVKIDNDVNARPQAGLDQADLVYQEVVEGRLTRFLAIFHSQQPDQVGPVRSFRSSDVEIIQPIGGVLGASGGIGTFRELFVQAKIALVDENDTEAMKRRSDRRAPHNLYTNIGTLAERAPADALIPPEFAKFLEKGKPFAAAGATPTTKMTISVGRIRSDYEWDAGSGTWKRSIDGQPHMTEGGGQVAPTNVIVQFVPYENTSERDASGSPVPVAHVTGSGEALILSGGMLVKGRWSKPSAGSVTTFTDASGGAITLSPGQTWVELPATGTTFTSS